MGIKWAVLIIDSKDEESKKIVEKLKNKGIKFETMMAGPKKEGYDVEFRINSRKRKDFINFETRFITPVLLVAYVKNVGIEIDVVEGESPIKKCLSKLSEVLSRITLMS